MECTDVIKLVEKLWSTTAPSERRSVFSMIRQTIPDHHLVLFDGLVDNKRNGIIDNPESKIVVLIHGIHTDGAWQKNVQKEFESVNGLHVHDLGYDVVTAAQLFGPFRSTPVNRIAREIRRIKDEEPKARISVIAHSFGTYIVSKILENHPDIRFDKIIMCGAIVSRSYPWDRNARDLSKSRIINDVGTKDIWPVIATCTTGGYGSSGRRGFQSASVTDRYFDYKHSDFFEPKNSHIRNYWKPIIETGLIPASDWDTKKGKTSFPILIASHPWIGRPLFFLIILGLGILSWKYFSLPTTTGSHSISAPVGSTLSAPAKALGLVIKPETELNSEPS